VDYELSSLNCNSSYNFLKERYGVVVFLCTPGLVRHIFYAATIKFSAVQEFRLKILKQINPQSSQE
jgi:hypothetical protein